MDTSAPSPVVGGHPTFPQEVFDLIIDTLGEIECHSFIEEIREDSRSDTERLLSYRDMSGLLACNLVSRAFADRARQHIFRRVEMIPLDSENDVDAWLDTMRELLGWRPTRNQGANQLCGIRSYIKEFSASDVNDSEAHMELETQDRLGEVLWSLNDVVNGLDELDLGIELPWSKLTVSLQQSIISFVQSYSLKTLKIYGFINLYPTLLMNSNIKHLRVVECFTSGSFDYTRRRELLQQGKIYPRLEVLETDCSIPAEHIACDSNEGRAGSLNGLRRLSIWLIDDRVFRPEAAVHLLSHTEQSLSRLELRYYPAPRMTLPAFHPTFHNLTQLRYLQLYYCEGTTRRPQVAFPRALADLLLCESTILPPNLETLEIQIAHPYVYTGREDMESPFGIISGEEVTGAIDRRVSDLSARCRMRKFLVHLQLHTSALSRIASEQELIGDLRAKLHNAFPLLDSRDLLDFRLKFSEDFDYYYSRNLEVLVPERHPMANV